MADAIDWIDVDAPEWQQQVETFAPTCLVHAAWSGVGTSGRGDWQVQGANVAFFSTLLGAAARCGVEQVIGLGSQAEYGSFEGKIAEDYPCEPASAYGAAKLSCLELLRTFGRSTGLAWTWLRVFSVYGPGEAANWFIPTVISEFAAGRSPQLSDCSQRYDYLHADDFSAAVLAAIERPQVTGVFNVGSGRAVALSEVVRTVQSLIPGAPAPDFGAIPQRPGQSMHMEADISRFANAFRFSPTIELIEGLRRQVEARPVDVDTRKGVVA